MTGPSVSGAGPAGTDDPFGRARDAGAPPGPRISSRTRVVALLGDPVEHSLSPDIQNAAFRAAGVDAVYVALRATGEELPGLLRGLAAAGGSGNVTLPHKELAATLVDEATEAVRRTGACNTFWARDGRIHGDNTDVEGFRGALDDFRKGSPPRRCLLLGAGGAARSVLVALLQDGAEEVWILNRSVERARSVARRIGDERVRVVETRREVEDEPFELLVHATPLGLSDEDRLPVDASLLGSVEGVFDVVYRPGGTELVRLARSRSIPAVDGSEMLVRQGAAAFARWWDRPAPIAAMREALREAGAG